MNQGSNKNCVRTLNTILVSKLLRRLKGKKQVFSLIGQTANVKYDYVHERLLHTLEVYSVAKDIAEGVNQATFKMFSKDGRKVDKHFPYSSELLEAICIAHDFGHTPFGHVGETALTHYMRGENGLLRSFKPGKSINSDLAFKHNYYSACLLSRKYHFCPDEIIDGVLKHTRTTSFDGKVIENPYSAFGANAYLSQELRKKPNYLQTENALTFEGQVVSIADEIAQILSDMEDSKIVLKVVFSKKEERKILFKKDNCSLKKGLINIRKQLVNGVVNQTCSNLKEHFENATRYEDQLAFNTKVVEFNDTAEKIYKEIDELRVGKLHKNDLVIKQNCLSYLVIYNNFDFYLRDIKNLFNNDSNSSFYINNNLCNIRDDSKYKKGIKTNRYYELKNYLTSKGEDGIFESIKKLEKIKKYKDSQVTNEEEKIRLLRNNLTFLCNYLADYYFQYYNVDGFNNQVLDKMSASLMREISYSIAKMTDRFALSVFYLSFNQSLEEIYKYIDNCTKLPIHTKQFDMKPEYCSYLKSRIKTLLNVDKESTVV